MEDGFTHNAPPSPHTTPPSRPHNFLGPNRSCLPSTRTNTRSSPSGGRLPLFNLNVNKHHPQLLRPLTLRVPRVRGIVRPRRLPVPPRSPHAVDRLRGRLGLGEDEATSARSGATIALRRDERGARSEARRVPNTPQQRCTPKRRCALRRRAKEQRCRFGWL